MRIGVVTFYKKNYGAFLQAFALQKTLIKVGYKPELIDIEFSNCKRIFGVPATDMKRPVSFLKQLLNTRRNKLDNLCKMELFKGSIQQHLRVSSKKYFTMEELYDTTPEYDLYLCGSDQVWNPNIYEASFASRFLTFAPKGKIVASYAASISTPVITNRQKKRMKQYLERFDIISVREDKTKEIIRELVPNTLVECHVDPCLILEVEEWNRIAKIPYERKPYIFVYKLQGQPDMADYINRLAHTLNAAVVATTKIKGLDLGYKIVSSMSPEAFIGYVRDSEYVVTNAFHGTIFAAIYNKRARFFLPKASNDRMLNFINNAGMQKLCDDSVVSMEELEAVYAKKDAYVRNEKERSIEYLKKLKNRTTSNE